MSPLFHSPKPWRHAPHPVFSVSQKDWLMRGGSLTRHLAMLGHVEVCLMREAADFVWPDESMCLKVRARLRVWVREVLLLVNGAPFVAARSITPLAASHSAWRVIRRLHTRPLADKVYKDDIQRSAFISRRVDMDGRLGQFVRHYANSAQPYNMARTVVARRSVFTRRGAPLLVTECLLTALWTYLAMRNG